MEVSIMNDDKILCPRCGEEMKRNSRYCMKCGYLNYDHPENAAMKSYMGKLQESTNYVNGKVEVRQFKGVKRGHEIRFGSNTGSYKDFGSYKFLVLDTDHGKEYI